MKQRWRRSREWKGRKTENESVIQRSKRWNSCTVILLLLLNVYLTHSQFIYGSIEKILHREYFSFYIQYNANRFSFLTNNTNSILIILINNLLTFVIISTVDIFTPFSRLVALFLLLQILLEEGTTPPKYFHRISSWQIPSFLVLRSSVLLRMWMTP